MFPKGRACDSTVSLAEGKTVAYSVWHSAHAYRAAGTKQRLSSICSKKRRLEQQHHIQKHLFLFVIRRHKIVVIHLAVLASINGRLTSSCCCSAWKKTRAAVVKHFVV